MMNGMGFIENTGTPYWLVNAEKYLGVTEIKGTEHNKQILFFFKNAGVGWFKDDETPWCAAFISSCLQECGIPNPQTARALDFLKYGEVLNFPHDGAIAVMQRRNAKGKIVGGHVGLVKGRLSDGRILILGANQNDSVCYAAFNENDRGIVYRWPHGVAVRPGKLSRLNSKGVNLQSVQEQ
jgi:uncharacterized protein (TIGR02594 family)